MEAGSFYSAGVNVTNSLAAGGHGHSHEASLSPPFCADSTPVGRQQPPYAPASARYPRDQSLVGVNQKLDRVLSLVLDQNSAIHQGQKETAELSRQLDGLSKSVDEVKRRVDQLQSSASARGGRKPVPKDLSAAVKRIHDKLDASTQFKGKEGYHSQHNEGVTARLLAQLKPKFAETHSPARLKRSVHRYYESRRRLFNDSKPSRSEVAKKNRTKSKKQALRKQLYERRKKYLKGKEEIEKWASIDANFMTEESDAADGETLVQHRIPWRSEELNKLVKKADKRYGKSPKQGSFKSKPRQPSTPSLIPVPSSFPSWAVKTDCIPATLPVVSSASDSESATSDSSDSSTVY